MLKMGKGDPKAPGRTGAFFAGVLIVRWPSTTEPAEFSPRAGRWSCCACFTIPGAAAESVVTQQGRTDLMRVLETLQPGSHTLPGYVVQAVLHLLTGEY